jgi:hypothetical protein
MALRGSTQVNVALIALVVVTIAALLWWKLVASSTATDEPPRPSVVAQQPADRPEHEVLTRPDPLTASPAGAVERTVVDAAGAAPSTTDATKTPIASIEGTVLTNRTPVHDATVFYGPVGAENDKSAGGHVFTNREGKFTIRPARDAEHRLMVTNDGFTVTSAVAKPGTPVVIELRSQSSTRTISGRVVEKGSRQPIEAFSMSLMYAKSKNSWQALSGRDVADSGGWFSEPLTVPGNDAHISVVFTATGYRDAHASREHVARSESVDLGEIEMEKLEGLPEGIVVDDRDGTPIANANVTPISDLGAAESSVATDANGHFRVESMRAKALSGFVAGAEGFALLWFDLERDAGREAGNRIVLRLRQGVEVRGRVIRKRASSDEICVGYWSDEIQTPMPGLSRIISDTVAIGESGDYALSHVPALQVTLGLFRRGKDGGMRGACYEQLSVVDLSDGQSRSLDFVIGEGVSLRAKPVAKGIPSNYGVSASLLRSDGSPLSVIDTSVGSNIEFHDLAPGQYVLRLGSTKTRYVDRPVSIGAEPVKLGDVDMSACFVKR